MSPEPNPSSAEENTHLRERIAELEETLYAIRTGQVDALVDGNDIYTLESAESASNRFRGKVLDQISETVIAVDNDRRITYINEAVEKQYGRTSADVLGLPVSALYEYKWVNPGDEDSALKSIRDQGMWRGENIHVKHTGEAVHVESVVKVMRDNEGGAIGLLAVMRDITQRVKDREALVESARQKDHFLATLAHELRNPLSPLMNGLLLLESGNTDVHLLDTTRSMMQRQLDLLVRLVDDLMDMSRISRGKLELRKEPLDLASVVAMAVETCKPLMDQKEHRLEVTFSPGSYPLIGDKARLAQIISNLLNNAGKYTPRGGRIAVNVAREGNELVLSVKDNGIGIAPDALERIFDMFTQVDGSLQGAGGLGIGLNIAQRLTRMHGGTLSVNSEGKGKGSTFTLRMPLLDHAVSGNGHAKGNAALATAIPLRILVADDNQDVASTLVLILRKAGHVVEVAFNGAEALTTGAVLKPDLIFMDIGMPVMGGIEACARMRAHPWGQRARIVAVSGWGQDQDRQRSHKAGFDEHLIKPIEAHTIQRMVQLVAQQRTALSQH